MLKIQNVFIEGIGPISDLRLDFDDSFNIICGQNGVGKTTILDCLAQSFNVGQTSLKRMANLETGKWSITINDNNEISNRLFEVNGFSPTQHKYSNNMQGFYLRANRIIVFKTHRDIKYKKLENIKIDAEKEWGHFANETLNGIYHEDLKNWFVHRHLWSAHENHLDKNQLCNLQLAKECFTILNPEITFKGVDPRTNDIFLNTPKGEVHLEYLSAGYKSCIFILLGLIKEIEFRNRQPTIFAKNYDGVLFIDEVDLHLHPDWQSKIYSALKFLLPNAQIFTTTHSPHIIQIAKPSEIIPLIVDEQNKVSVNEIINKEFGCQGWTVEEILKDVMGMAETRTDTYLDAINGYNSALDEENYEKAKEQYLILDNMLHPDNTLRKILKIQLIGLENND